MEQNQQIIIITGLRFLFITWNTDCCVNRIKSHDFQLTVALWRVRALFSTYNHQNSIFLPVLSFFGINWIAFESWVLSTDIPNTTLPNFFPRPIKFAFISTAKDIKLENPTFLWKIKITESCLFKHNLKLDPFPITSNDCQFSRNVSVKNV